MKFRKEEISGAERTRYVFALGKNEAKLMRALLLNAYKHTPDLPLTGPLKRRMNNMIKAIGEALPEMEDQDNI